MNISPNYSWFNRTDSKAQYISQVPQLGGEIGVGFHYKYLEKIHFEPGMSILLLRNKSVSTVEGSDLKINDGELFTRLNLRITFFYLFELNHRMEGSFSLGTAASFGAKLKSEFINEIHSYYSDTYRNWNQLMESGIGLYYMSKLERKYYYGLRTSFGLRTIAEKRVIHMNEENNFKNRNNHCSFVFQIYLK